jgi:hypothetical protein
MRQQVGSRLLERLDPIYADNRCDGLTVPCGRTGGT